MAEIATILCSRDAARRFTKFCWAINDTPFWFHQTLTFGDDTCRLDVEAATARLNALLDQLDKAWPDCACLWVREQQWKGGIHFHVIFFFFGDRKHKPETLHREFSTDVFERWEKLNNGKVVRKANQMTIPDYRAKDSRSFGYLTRNVRIVKPKERTTRGVSWWGRRNVKLIEANSTPLTKAEASAALKALFPAKRAYVRKSPAKPKTPMEPFPKFDISQPMDTTGDTL